MAKQSWPQARKTCQVYVPANGDLASVPNSATNDFLRKLSAVPGAEFVWLGGEKTGGVWQWSDGTPWGFDAWSAGQPSAGSGVNSVCLSLSNNTGVNGYSKMEVKYLRIETV